MASRVVKIQLVLSRGTPSECPECLFDSLENFTVHILTPSGVDARTRQYCPRCRADDGRA